MEFFLHLVQEWVVFHLLFVQKLWVNPSWITRYLCLANKQKHNFVRYISITSRDSLEQNSKCISFLVFFLCAFMHASLDISKLLLIDWILCSCSLRSWNSIRKGLQSPEGWGSGAGLSPGPTGWPQTPQSECLKLQRALELAETAQWNISWRLYLL